VVVLGDRFRFTNHFSYFTVLSNVFAACVALLGVWGPVSAQIRGAAVLYMIFVTWAQLANSPGRPADGVLLVAAFVGATLAVAVSVVISATERPEPNEEPAPAMAGRHVPVR